MLLRWLLDVCSIRVLAKKNHGDPYYEPTIVVHDNSMDGFINKLSVCDQAFEIGHVSTNSLNKS